MKKAIFLDRDGTILNERGYLGDPKKMVFYSSAFKGLRSLQKQGFKLVIVSNQSGLARKYFTMADFKKVNTAFKRQLVKKGIHISKLYFCPHLPNAGCRCRKPQPGMPLRAVRDLGVSLGSSYVIGDQERDIELARRIKAKGVLVLTGAGKYYRRAVRKKAAKICPNLDAASRWIESDQAKL